jgi:3-oxoacyl-[acyl-carrier-protein] synthase-1
MRRVVITGLGIVSSLGNDKASVSESLRLGKSGIRFNPVYADMGFRSQISGRPDIDLDALIDRKDKRFMGDAAAYATVAMQLAIADAGLATGVGLSAPYRPDRWLRRRLIYQSGGGGRYCAQ